MAEDVTPTVVGVSTIRQLSSPGSIPRQGRFKVPGSGSGVVIHEDGYIVTNITSSVMAWKPRSIFPINRLLLRKSWRRIPIPIWHF